MLGRWVSAMMTLGGLILVPFGSVSDRLKESNPWRATTAEGPDLLVVRAERISLEGKGDCARWADAAAQVPGVSLGSDPAAQDWSGAWHSWEPWSAEDLSDIRDCRKIPCLIKFNDSEVASLARFPESLKLEKYLGLIAQRVLQYEKTGEHPAYEIPGPVVDPRKFFLDHGFRSGLSMPPRASFKLRRLDFAPGRIKPLRQVLDVRVAFSVDHRSSTTWVRDVYTNHYFDAWGEWIGFSCSEDFRSGLLVQAFLGELDLLKKGDLFSRLSRGRVRSAFFQSGTVYLDQEASRIRKRANP